MNESLNKDYDYDKYSETRAPEGLTEESLNDAMLAKEAEDPQTKAAKSAENKLKVLTMLEEMSQTQELSPKLQELARKTKQEILANENIELLDKQTKEKVDPRKYIQTKESRIKREEAFDAIIMPELKENVAHELTNYVLTGILPITKEYTHIEGREKNGLLEKTVKKAIYSTAYFLFNIFCTIYFINELINPEKNPALWYLIIVSLFILIGFIITIKNMIAPFRLRKKVYETSIKNPFEARESLKQLKTEILAEKLDDF